MNDVFRPKPFLKWVGGKAKSVEAIRAHFPATWNPETDLYVEPFLGGGALFFAVQPQHAILNDANSALVWAYRVLQQNVEGVLAELTILERKHYTHGAELYQHVRENMHKQLPAALLAAYFIFINKAGFNGLYRVNKAGKCNVPWGKNPKVRLCDPENLRLCAQALHAATLLNYDFSELFAGEGVATLTDWPSAVIYCDPPYVPVSKTANFTSYTPGGFTYADQIRLLAKAIEWKRNGATVLLSQAADEGLRNQYLRCGFQCEVLQCRRNVNSKGGARGPVDEYLFHAYPVDNHH
jgi:DNA adenine methylase